MCAGCGWRNRDFAPETGWHKSTFTQVGQTLLRRRINIPSWRTSLHYQHFLRVSSSMYQGKRWTVWILLWVSLVNCDMANNKKWCLWNKHLKSMLQYYIQQENEQRRSLEEKAAKRKSQAASANKRGYLLNWCSLCFWALSEFCTSPIFLFGNEHKQ